MGKVGEIRRFAPSMAGAGGRCNTGMAGVEIVVLLHKYFDRAFLVTMITLTQVDLPDFGIPAALPTISAAEYEQRLGWTVERMERENLEVLVVYADREHSANLNYLIGFDPRFEEAMLLLDRKGQRLLLVGNECMGYLPEAARGCRVELFQEFSLMGQPREGSAPLQKLLADFGIGKGVMVGCAGWKFFSGPNIVNPQTASEIPSYIVDALRDLAGTLAKVVNANQLFMSAEDGLRLFNSTDQIARFEYAAAYASTSVHRALASLREGIAEKEVARHYDCGGLPLSCHPMVSFGDKARRGLASPSDRQAKHGDAFTLAFGVEGGLTARAGVIAAGPEELGEALRDFYPRFVANYFAVVVAWYEAVKVGAVAGEVFAAVEAARDPALFAFALNPGHYIHLDEWVHSPFARDSRVALQSGMALQSDIIPVAAGPFCCSNAEDGIVLADEKLRAEIAARHPECWQRIAARRRFMREALGIRLHDSVLPLSNTPAWLAPYALALKLALRVG
jgi:Xaa-Pro aminopeptidase